MKFCNVGEDATKLLEGDNLRIEDRIAAFIASQSREGLSDSIVNTRLAAIKLFYDMNRRPLAWKLIRKSLQATKKHKDRAYTREEITKMLGLADIRAEQVCQEILLFA